MFPDARIGIVGTCHASYSSVARGAILGGLQTLHVGLLAVRISAAAIDSAYQGSRIEA